MDLRVTSVAVILMMVFAYGDALRCYQSESNGKTSVVDCKGPCLASTTYLVGGKTVTVQQCTNIGGYEDFCIYTKGCSCYTDLCNTGSDTSNLQIGAPNPQSCAPNPQSGALNPQGGASGCVAFKITWFLAALMVIGARYLF